MYCKWEEVELLLPSDTSWVVSCCGAEILEGLVVSVPNWAPVSQGPREALMRLEAGQELAVHGSVLLLSGVQSPAVRGYNSMGLGDDARDGQYRGVGVQVDRGLWVKRGEVEQVAPVSLECLKGLLGIDGQM